MDATVLDLLVALRSRTWIASAALAVLGAAAGGAIPLLEVPGLELGLCVSIATALVVAPACGVAAVRRARSGPSAPAPVLRPFVATGAACLLVAAIAWGGAAARAAVLTPCRPAGASGLFALVALPSALLAVAAAVAAAVIARGRRLRAALLYAAVVLASLLSTGAAAYLGPAAFAHDHLLGIWPGPIYDEVIPIDARLLLFRAGTLAWTAAALAIAALVGRRRAGVAVGGPAAALAGAAAAIVIAHVSGGAGPTRAELAAELGAVREGRRCVVHLAAERGAAEADRALRDCEYDAEVVAGALGLVDAPRATVWIYRSPQEKRRLVGAAQTSYTKPWLAEIHVHDQGVPHPILRHELVHALASAAARGPLRVPARAMMGVDLGLVEGLAVAIDVPADEYGVHAWARALRDQGRLPRLQDLLATAGFFGAPASRAYVAAGSFLRFLLETRGAATVRAVYRDDDLARATGETVPALERAWHRHLDGIPVPAPLATAAEARFERGSLFARACAREVAGLEHDAAEASARGRAARAEHLLRRASLLSGGDPAPLRGAAEAWRSIGELGRAEAVAGEAIAAADAAGARGALRASLRVLLGDLRMRGGDAEGAAAEYRRAQALLPDRAESRAIAARLALTRDPALARSSAPWLLSIGDPAVALARLASSGAPLSRYLLARAELARGAPGAALETLRTLDDAALPGDGFAEEARRMRAEALCRDGRWGEGIRVWDELARGTALAGARERSLDGARRCAFERSARPGRGGEAPQSKRAGRPGQ